MDPQKSSSARSSEMPKRIGIPSFMRSNNKTQQEEDEGESFFKIFVKANLFYFWRQQMEEILQAPDLKKKQELPLSRVRRAIKSTNQVNLVSAHTTVLFAKACEMFILELTIRAWMQAEQAKRRTLQRYDIARAIRNEELLDFLEDIVPLQSNKGGEEANYGQGNAFHPAFQMVQPNYIPVELGANGGQGNDFHLAYQMLQPNNIPYQFHVETETNVGHRNEYHPAYQMVQPNNNPVERYANHGGGKEVFPAYQMVQPNNNPIQEVTNDGQGNEFHPANQMVQPNNIPASFVSLQGIPAQVMVQSMFNSSTEAEFASDGIARHKKGRH